MAETVPRVPFTQRFVLVVFDENDLCAGFEFQFHQRGERTFRELALYFAFKECAFGVYFG